MTSDPEQEHLLAIIEEAFSGVHLEDGVSANMAEYYDCPGAWGASRYLELAKWDERDDWRKVSDATLEQHNSILYFTDLKGFKFYVPAFMQYAVRHHESWAPSIIVPEIIYALSPDHLVFKDTPFERWFTCEQITAIIRFLEYCVVRNGTLDVAAARKNLEQIRGRMET